jgi:hypothetical protein
MIALHALGRALYAEHLKLRGTLALWVSAIAPAVIVLLYVLQLSFQNAPKVVPDTATAWLQLGQACLVLWSMLMLPLFITLEAALLGALEHSERQFKHLLALPLPRAVHYLAKLLTLAALLLLAMFVLVVVLMPLGGWLLGMVSALPLRGWPPLATWLESAWRIYVCALLIVALHTAIALHWRSFTVVVTIGMSATVMGVRIGQSADYGPWFPWTMPLQPLTQHPQIAQVMLSSVIAGLLVSLLGAWLFARREVH